MTNINDRGAIKWTPFMMPEHTEMLNKYWQSENDVEKPILSEDQYHEINQVIQKAINDKLKVTVEYYENHRIIYRNGWIKRSQLNKLELETSDGIDYLKLSDILNVLIE